MATATIDVRVLGAGFMAKVMRRGMTTALDEVGRRIKRDHDKMNAAYGTDYDAAVEDCLGVVAAVRTDAESAPLPEDEAPTAAQWLDAPAGDGLWWCYVPGSGDAPIIARVEVGHEVAFVGTGYVATWDDMPPRKWLRVDVPEAPR